MFLATPFIWRDPARDEVTVEPTLYGMWMFAFATWNGARLVAHSRLRVNDAANATNSWALRDDDGNLVVLLVRKDQAQANVTVTLQLAGVGGGYEAHSIEASAPSVTSRKGISMAGLTWEGTTDGLPVPVASATTAGYHFTTLAARVSRSGGSGGHDGQQAIVEYDLVVQPASVLAVVIPTADDAGASWKRRVSTILRSKREANTGAVEN